MRSQKTMFTMTLLMGISISINAEYRNDFTHTQNVIDITSNVQESDISGIINAYLSIKDALVSTDGVKASTAAQQFVASLGNVKGELLAKIKIDGNKIAGTKDAGIQRKYFNSLSDNMYALAKSSDLGGISLYRQYCPMAMNNNGAYWLSANKEVLNPYFGDMMLRCGSVKEEL